MPGPVFLPGGTIDLRTIEEADLSFLQTHVNDPAVWRQIGRPDPIAYPEEQTFYEEVICGEDGVHLLVATDAETPVGIVSLTAEQSLHRRAELGYWIAPTYHNNGYGSEAAAILVDYGLRDRGLHRIDARAFASNTASQRLLESLGFTEEGRIREAIVRDGGYDDLLWYGVLADEWESLRGEVVPAETRTR